MSGLPPGRHDWGHGYRSPLGNPAGQYIERWGSFDMPLTGAAKAAYQREYVPAYRARKRADAAQEARLKGTIAEFQGPDPEADREFEEWGDTPVERLCNWSEAVLKVPAGPMRGKPFSIEPWQRRWLTDAMAPGIGEAGLSVARKNGKSGLVAAALLGYLAGPVAPPEWRGVVVSVTGDLSRELWRAMEGTARASGLLGITFTRSPPPMATSGDGQRYVTFLAADRSTGHGIGADLVVIDEAGLLLERDRELWSAAMSSMGGRGGRVWAISIQGDGPMFRELRERRNDPEVVWHEYCAPVDCDLGDEAAWEAANPGLGGIKSRTYMRRQAKRAAASPADQAAFRAHDLNQPQDPERIVIVSVRQWMACATDGSIEDGGRRGPCFAGLDLGGSASMSAFSAYWPETGYLRVWGAFPEQPDLLSRGKNDGVGGIYEGMRDEGSLTQFGARTTDVAAWLPTVIDALGCSVVALGMDRYRKEEAGNVFATMGVHWPVEWRGTGANVTADGSTDIRAFQRAVLSEHVRHRDQKMMRAAIAGSAVTFDVAGNPRLDKAKARWRIDALQAAVIAVGLGERWRARKAGRSAGFYRGAV